MDPHKHYSIYSWICRVTWKLSKQDSSPATGCLRMWEPMCSSGQGLLHSSIVKSLARDVAGFSRPVRWYSEPLQLMHISVERANLVPGLFPQDLAGHPFPLAHLEKVSPPLCQQYLEALPPHTGTREDRGDTGGFGIWVAHGKLCSCMDYNQTHIWNVQREAHRTSRPSCRRACILAAILSVT